MIGLPAWCGLWKVQMSRQGWVGERLGDLHGDREGGDGVWRGGDMIVSITHDRGGRNALCIFWQGQMQGWGDDRLQDAHGDRRGVTVS